MSDPRLLAIAEALAGVCELQGRQSSPAMVKLWSQVLHDIHHTDIVQALMEHVRTSTAWVQPAHIRALCGDAPEQQAELAYQALDQARREHGSYRSIVLEARTMAACVRAGGWPYFCALTPHQDVWFKKAFIQAYLDPTCSQAAPRALQGLHGATPLLLHVEGERGSGGATGALEAMSGGGYGSGQRYIADQVAAVAKDAGVK